MTADILSKAINERHGRRILSVYKLLNVIMETKLKVFLEIMSLSGHVMDNKVLIKDYNDRWLLKP